MDAKEIILKDINRVANMHFVIKPAILIPGLKNFKFNEDGKNFFGAENMHQVWDKSFEEKFFDMGSLIRLGSEVEKGLKYYFMDKKKIKNLHDFTNDPIYKKGVFQRILPWKSKETLIRYFKENLNYDIESNSHFRKIQELIIYRHLFVHNAGLLDQEFVDDYFKITNIDLEKDPITRAFVTEDIFFFKPLEKLNELIESAVGFIKELP